MTLIESNFHDLVSPSQYSCRTDIHSRSSANKFISRHTLWCVSENVFVVQIMIHRFHFHVENSITPSDNNRCNSSKFSTHRNQLIVKYKMLTTLTAVAVWFCYAEIYSVVYATILKFMHGWWIDQIINNSFEFEAFRFEMKNG